VYDIQIEGEFLCTNVDGDVRADSLSWDAIAICYADREAGALLHGEAYAGGRRGVDGVEPESTKASRRAPPTYMASYRVDGA
jgi:hypothetical protein